MSPCSTTQRSQYLSSVLVEVLFLPAGGVGGKVVQSSQRTCRGERVSYSRSDGEEAHRSSGLCGSVENMWITTLRSFTSRNSILHADLQKVSYLITFLQTDLLNNMFKVIGIYISIQPSNLFPAKTTLLTNGFLEYLIQYSIHTD